MLTCKNISKNFLNNKNYEVLIIDVNSLFLFGGKNSIKSMYQFIDSVKKSVDNNLLVINVIDNGISSKVLRKFPYYKGNRTHSVQSNNIYINKFSSSQSFKYKITRIHKIDNEFNNHLTFYLPGEADFKVGWLLKFIQERTPFTREEVLTVSFDKDYLLCCALSDVLLKRVHQNKRYWCLLDKNLNLDQFKETLKIADLNIKNTFDYFYYLVVNGDGMDNIKQLLTRGQTIKFLNFLYNKYGKLSLEHVCHHITEFNGKINCNDIIENCYLVDLFNKDVFTHNQINNMTYVFSNFLKQNNIRVQL